MVTTHSCPPSKNSLEIKEIRTHNDDVSHRFRWIGKGVRLGTRLPVVGDVVREKYQNNWYARPLL